MKLCRFGERDHERWGLIDGTGQLRDLSGAGPVDLSAPTLARLAAIDPATLPAVAGKPRLGVPVQGVGKFIGIGLNYSDHAAEIGMAPPSEPVVFMKAVTCLNGPDDDIVQPRLSTKLDWEVELGVVIGTRATDVSVDKALSHVAGYTLVNDVSERAFQLQSSQWDKGKGCDTFGPVGPWLVTADEVPDPQNLNLWLDVNGQRMQTGNSRTMIFDVKTIVSYLSRYMTLLPGDIIATGTPPGVGQGKKPDPVFLKPGDVMSLGIDGMGQQTQRVVAAA